MVGGGNYIEYQNLMDHANSKASLMASGLSSSNLAGMYNLKGHSDSCLGGRKLVLE